MYTNTNLHLGYKEKYKEGEVLLLDAEGNLILDVVKEQPKAQHIAAEPETNPFPQKHKIYVVKELGVNAFFLIYEAAILFLGLVSNGLLLLTELIRMLNRTKEYNSKGHTEQRPPDEKTKPNVNVNVKVVIK